MSIATIMLYFPILGSHLDCHCCLEYSFLMCSLSENFFPKVLSRAQCAFIINDVQTARVF